MVKIFSSFHKIQGWCFHYDTMPQIQLFTGDCYVLFPLLFVYLCKFSRARHSVVIWRPEILRSIQGLLSGYKHFINLCVNRSIGIIAEEAVYSPFLWVKTTGMLGCLLQGMPSEDRNRNARGVEGRQRAVVYPTFCFKLFRSHIYAEKKKKQELLSLELGKF